MKHLKGGSNYNSGWKEIINQISPEKINYNNISIEQLGKVLNIVQKNSGFFTKDQERQVTSFLDREMKKIEHSQNRKSKTKPPTKPKSKPLSHNTGSSTKPKSKPRSHKTGSSTKPRSHKTGSSTKPKSKPLSHNTGSATKSTSSKPKPKTFDDLLKEAIKTKNLYLESIKSNKDLIIQILKKKKIRSLNDLLINLGLRNTSLDFSNSLNSSNDDFYESDSNNVPRKKNDNIRMQRIKELILQKLPDGPKLTKLKTYPDERSKWSFEENQADGNCLYESVLRGIEIQDLKGDPNLKGLNNTKYYKKFNVNQLRIDLYEKFKPIDSSKPYELKFFPPAHLPYLNREDKDFARTQDRPPVGTQLREDEGGILVYNSPTYGEGQQIQALANFFGTCIAVWVYPGGLTFTSEGMMPVPWYKSKPYWSIYIPGISIKAGEGQVITIGQEGINYKHPLTGDIRKEQNINQDLENIIDGLEESSRIINNKCKKIIYLLNKGGQHYFLISPKKEHDRPSTSLSPSSSSLPSSSRGPSIPRPKTKRKLPKRPISKSRSSKSRSSKSRTSK